MLVRIVSCLSCKLLHSGNEGASYCCSSGNDGLKKIGMGQWLHILAESNTGLNDLRIIIWENLKLLLKEFQFVMPLKT